ncbi:MAG: aminotransferase class I/II-fold pyridoxal phosphate-dependent enzyme [Silvanigrellales bacterium]|jgi:aspartate aminotransferase|nr:aminotransferase class I/II-fold pyridoxal phosphate-dependent enzyme [Silvanigrellales bacterium]
MSVNPRANILDSLSLGKIVQIREQLLKAQSAGRQVFRLESGDPNFSVAPHVLAALQKAAADGKTHYIPNAGIPELRKALHTKLVTRNGIPVPSPENVFVTNGAMHALFCTFQCLLDEGDEVIVPDPMWTEVVENIKLARGTPVGVPLKAEHDFQYLPRDIISRITPRTKALFLNTPHNPTGAVLSKERLLDIGRLAKERGLFLISDEAYEDVLFAPNEHISIASLFPEYAERIVSIFSFSKSYAMSGLRTGYLATTHPVLMDRLQKVLRCSINGVNSVAQWTALAAISGPQDQLATMRDEYLVRRDILLSALKGIPGVHAFAPRGSFFVWAELDQSVYARAGVKNADELSAFLAERGVGSAPGEAFGDSCHNAIRFAFSCETKMVEEGAKRLVELLK